ncbi:MAG TPA: hypothetical protein VI979_00695 [archaeon]|nr:hypothetical protein [archaeon]
MKGTSMLNIGVTIAMTGIGIFFIIKGFAGENVPPALLAFAGILMIVEQILDMAHAHG